MPDEEDKIPKLEKSVYGLRESATTWQEKRDDPIEQPPPATEPWPVLWKWAERLVGRIAYFVVRSLGKLNSVQIQSLSLSLQHNLGDACEEIDLEQ